MVDDPGTPRWAWFDGCVIPFSEARVPIEDRGLQLGESLYELIAVLDGEPFRLASHVERMRRGAAELECADGLPTDEEEWAAIIAELHRREAVGAALLYAQLTGGSAPRALIPESPPQPLFFAYLRPHSFPGPTEVARGIAAMTLPDSRWQRCDLKTPMLLPAVLARKEAAGCGAAEAIFIAKDGYVSDAASSTVFAVRQRTVRTAPPTRRTLPGTSAEVVRELCRDLGISFAEKHLTFTELIAAEELFIASTSQLVMPVVTIDGTPVGPGTPGPVTLQIAYHFQRLFWGTSGP